MRFAVLDTNILVSGLIRSAGPPGQVMAAVNRGELVPVFSPLILDEYADVLSRPRLRLDEDIVRTALVRLREAGHLVTSPLPPVPAGLPDSADWPFMACALASGCPVVTGNLKHFPAWLGVRVMSAREWVDMQMA